MINILWLLKFMKKNNISTDDFNGNSLEIYLDFKKDLILIANQFNDSVIYSIQDDDILQTNIKNKTFFQDLITKGDWKKIIDFY
ncbi:MAG: hypothetical protein K0S93_1689 [Nitrososphaeraceae archaeon]|nr:hypothetical protein [Nitrososphaeraceae archaeon]